MTRTTQQARAIRRVGVLTALGVCVGALAGCYTKVIDAHGIGADQIAPKREKPTTTFIEDIGNALERKDK
ncbi:MAG: hypothetical protein R3B49_01030 [Phycisphaerales bacterium]